MPTYAKEKFSAGSAKPVFVDLTSSSDGSKEGHEGRCLRWRWPEVLTGSGRVTRRSYEIRVKKQKKSERSRRREGEPERRKIA